VSRTGFTDERSLGGAVLEVGFDVFEEIVRPVIPVFAVARFIGRRRTGGYHRVSRLR
jgi:hypothetical protein